MNAAPSLTRPCYPLRLWLELSLNGGAMKKISVYKVLQVLIVACILTSLSSTSVHAVRGEGTLGRLISQISTAGRDYYYDFEVADNGDILISGVFDTAVDLDPTAGVDTHTPVGAQDSFITKLHADGTYAWSHSWGSTSHDNPFSITVDASGNVLVVGSVGAGAVDFDSSGAGDIRTVTSSQAGHITRINSDGSYNSTELLENSSFTSIALDGAGNIIIGGSFEGTADFDFGVGTDSHTSSGSSDIFVAKYDPSLGHIFTRVTGGTSFDYLQVVTTDSNNDIIYGGSFSDTVDLDPTAGVQNATIGFSYGAFFAKITASGDFGFAKDFGTATTPSDTVKRIVTDSSNNIIIGGHISGDTDLDKDNPGGEVTSQDTMDIVSAKYSSSGVISYAGVHPSNGIVNTTLGVDLDSAGNIFVTSDVDAGPKDYDPTSGTDTITTVGSGDLYVTKITPESAYGGTFFIESEDTTLSAPSGMKIASDNTIYLLGSNFAGDTDLDPGSGSTVITGVGDLDGFLATYTFTSFNTVSGLSSELGLKDNATSSDITDEANGGITSGATASATLTHNGMPLALLDLRLTNDADWSDVSGLTDSSSYQSVVNNLANADGVTGSHSLYVPRRLNDTGVVICPAATNLSHIEINCDDAYILTELDDNASIVEVDGNSYWLISGLSGTGGMSLSDEEFLAATGTAVGIQVGVGMLVSMVAILTAISAKSISRN